MFDREPTRPKSGAAPWPILARFIESENALGEWAAKKRSTAFLYEFTRFGVKQAWACLFGGLMIALLIGTFLFYPKNAALPRYDFLVVASLAIQITLVATKLETIEEAKVIFLFHLVGTLMEIFKTAVGSWTYPEANYLRFGGVPLFTGFMYAAVGSYISRSWRLFDYRFTRYPPVWSLLALAALIYANFFSNYWGHDYRWWIFGVALVLMGRSFIHYKVWHEHRSMPMLVACGLAAFFIWIGENVGTYTNAWLYPHQTKGWSIVGFSKYSSWFLLLIISYALVAMLHRPRKPD